MRPETQYLLDGAMEWGQLTAMEYTCLYEVPHCNANVDGMLDARGGLPDDFLENTAQDFLRRLTPDARHLVALRALRHIAPALGFFAERVEFLVKQKVQSDLGEFTATRMPFLAESLGAYDHQDFQTIHDVTPQQVTAWVTSRFQNAYFRWELEIEAVHRALEWAQTANPEVAKAGAQLLFHGRLPSDDPSMLNVRELVEAFQATRQHDAKIQRKKQSLARASIKKAFKTLERFGQSKNVSLLVSGQEVVLQHPQSPFKLILRGMGPNWLETQTIAPARMSPFNLELYTKDEVFLARLCVYFESTPVLDQLLALTMFVNAGDEDHVLASANWMGFEDVAAVREYVGQHRPHLLERLPAIWTPSASTKIDDGTKSERANRLAEVLYNSPAARSDRAWQQFKGPVKTWVGDWLAPIRQPLQMLTDSSAAPALT